MKHINIKKINAILTLLTCLMLLDHVLFLSGWLGTGGTMFGINLSMARVLLTLAALHGLLSMSIVMFGHDGSSGAYASLNRRTIVQRFSGMAILVLLLVHMMPSQGGAEIYGMRAVFYALLFAAVFVHVAVSFSKALITLGLAGSEKTIRRIDGIVYVLCGVLFVLAVATLIIFVTGRV